ncbi:hypothetical protein QBC41DRAFT_386411 [Cercophora samala]|uniref:Uncharacterized protein n=1 Tax=Cercophora samala TaxID=330535 RepID=A0AA40DEI9_9PEZI|nr:hypothetical protein QBC41DRAFT_386411 [Cercophora samala]
MYLSSALVGGLLLAGVATAGPARGVSNKNVKRGDDGACHEDNVYRCFVQSVDAASAFCTDVLQATDTTTITPTVCLDAISISPAEATSACSCIGITTVTASTVTSYVSATEPATLIEPTETESSSEPTNTEISLEPTVETETSVPTDITTVDETTAPTSTDCPAATTIVSTITQVEVQTAIHTASQDVATVTEIQTATLPPVVETVTETAVAETTLVSTITEVVTETQTHVQTDTHLQTDTHFHTESHFHTDTELHTETQTQTLTETETLTQTQTEVETQTRTQTEVRTSTQVSSFTSTVTATASASASACPTGAVVAPIKNGNFEGNHLRGWETLATTGSGGRPSIATTSSHNTPQGRHFLDLYTSYHSLPTGPSSLTYGQNITCVAGVEYRLYYDSKMSSTVKSAIRWSVKVGSTTMHTGNGASFDWTQRSSTFDCHDNPTRNVLKLQVSSTASGSANMSFDNFVVVPVTVET